MAKRQASRKLLFGLGTTTSISAIATLMGLGINALATYQPNDLDRQVANFANSVNSISPFADIANNPDIEKVEASMFKKLPTGLERFHFGNVQTGATMTPLGWLGVTRNNEVILTSWSGEVLWKTANMGNTVRALRYDATMNRVNVYMSSGETGLFQYNGKSNTNSIAALNAQNGALVWKPQHFETNTNLKDFAEKAYRVLKAKGWLDLTNNNQKWKGKNLYNFDSSVNSGNVIFSWIPNFMLLNQNDGRLVNLYSLLDGIDDLIKFKYIFGNGNLSGQLQSLNLKANLLKGANGVKLEQGSARLYIPTGDNYIDLNYTYLLTSPFFILNASKSADIHFFFATHDGNTTDAAKNVRVFHLVMELNFTNSGQAQFNTFQFEKLASNIISLPTDQIVNAKGANHFFQEIDNLNSKLVTTSPANMIVNRNMFDPNLVTFAYPYANSKPRDQNAYDTRGQTVPAYNVAQIRFNHQGKIVTNSSDALKTLNFNIGQQYVDKPAEGTSSWPANDLQSVELNSNRLLTVSPFDNSFTYGAMLSSSDDSISASGYHPQANPNDFFPIWVVSGYQPNSNSKLRAVPLLITNKSQLGGQIDGNMTDMNNLRQNGLIFAPTDPSQATLNFYFDLSGGDNRSAFGGPNSWTTTKVGALKAFNLDSYSKFNQKVLNKNHFQTITRDNFATIVHDRADIKQWYPRTKFSIEKPATTIGANTPIANGDNGGRVTIDPSLKLRDFSGSSGTAQVVDLVSHYQKTTLSEQLRNNLPVINPQILTTANSFNSNQLEVRTSLSVKPTQRNWYQNVLKAKPQLFDHNYNETISQTSWVVYGQLGTQIKMTNMIDRFGSFSPNSNSISATDVINPTWWDARKGAFNNKTMNNNISVNGIQPARLLLQIVEPDSSVKPPWMQNQTFDQKVWKPAPLAKDRYDNESDFNTILKLYMNQVSKHINNQSTSKWSIANIEIRAFLAPNPNFATDGKIWTFKNQAVMQAKSDRSLVVFDLNNVDQDNQGTIYKQMATSYQEMQNQGYGSAVANLIRPNWTNLPTNKKLIFDMPILGNTGGWEQLAWPILRKGSSFSDSNPILKVAISGNTLSLKPINNDASEWNWLKFLLQNLNYKYGMFLMIESYNGQAWTPINSNQQMYNDQAITNATNEAQKTINFTFNQNPITKIRLRLVPLTTQHNSDRNQFIQWESRNQIDAGSALYKLTSAEYPVNANQLMIDNTWFNDQQMILSSANKFLNQLSVNDLKNYLNQIKTKFKAINNNSDDLWNKLDVSFVLAGETISGSLSNDQVLNNLLGKLQQLQNDHNRTDYNLNQGLFYLWTGGQSDTKAFKIQVKFQVSAQFSNQFELVDPQGNGISDAYQSNQFIRSNVATKIDIKPYFDALAIQKIAVVPGNQIGSVQSYQIPTLLNTNTLIWNKSFDQIKAILSNIGIKFSFQAQNQQGNWTNWNENLNDNSLKTYLPTNPQLKIKTATTAGWSNTKIYYDTTDVSGIDNNTPPKEFLIGLDVPKLIAIPSDFANVIKTQVQSIKPFGGNTYNLNIDQVDKFETKLLELIKAASNPVGNSHDQIGKWIEFTYSIGNQFSNLSAAELQSQLATNQTNLNTNLISLKIMLKSPNPGQKPEFVLDPSFNQPFTVLENHNEVVKIYLHGNQLEPALDQIQVNGDRLNLTYLFPQILDPFKNGTTVNDLKLQWAYDQGKDPDHNQLNWQEGPLPNNLDPSTIAIDKLYVRIAHDDTIKYSIYGPQEDVNNWHIGTIDLSKINYLVQVNNQWFSEVAIVNQATDVNQITINDLESWSQTILAKTNLNESQILDQIKIEFSFDNATWSDAATLVSQLNKINNDQLLEFWDGQSAKTGPYQIIKARFNKDQSSVITFVDQNSQPITNNDQLVGDVNSHNLITTINLDQYVHQLETEKTRLEIDGQPGKIKPNSLTPPANGTTGALANLNFHELRSQLQKHQIDFQFAPNVSANDDLLAWTTYEQTLTYDATLAKMAIRLESNAKQLKINFKSQLVPNGQLIYSDKVIVNLDAPKVITIEAQDYTDLSQAFSGNTKKLTLNLQAINAKIAAIKKRHLDHSNNSDFEQMPLNIEVSVGNQPWVAADQVVSQLDRITTDLPDRSIRIRYVLTNSDPQWILTGLTQSEVASDPNSPLKLFVHDQGLWNDLQTISFSGTNQSFKWIWPPDYQIDLQTGVITNNQNKAKGLKIEVTFNKTLSPINGATGTDPYQQWTSQLPSSFDPNKVPEQKIYLRVVPIDQTYVYEKAPTTEQDKIVLDLNLKTILKVDAAWLNQSLSTQPIDIKNLNDTIFQTYEKLVFDQLKTQGWTEQQIKLININYQFNGQVLNQAQLVGAIQGWQDNMGWLQLWNNHVGQQIQATFVKANQSGNYDLEWTSQNHNYTLDTSNVITTIDFSAVVNWLLNTKIAFDPDTTNQSIKKLKFGQVSATGTNFDQKLWDDLVLVLTKMQVIVEYREVANDQNPVISNWNSDYNLIKKYDDRNQFQVRFRLKSANEATNIKFVIDNQTTLDKTNLTSNSLIATLKTALNIRLDQNLINQTFINAQNVIGGNTKDLVIDQKLANQLIEKIKVFNSQYNPSAKDEFARANLTIQYTIGSQANQWFNYQDFISHLNQSTIDQSSNQINFKFVVENTDPNNPEFQVSNQVFVLNPHQNVNQVDQSTKVKYFVHTNQWETQADAISINGTNQHVNWNFSAFGLNNVIFNGNQVFLKINNVAMLQIDFTTNATAAYGDQTLTADHKQGWTINKPQQFDLDVSILKVRIRPINQGIIYEAAKTSSARVHQIALNIKKAIVVDRKWLNGAISVANQSQLVSDLALQDIQTYEQSVLDNINDPIAKQELIIKYRFNGQTNLNASQLLTNIQALKQVGSSTLGIVQLWNGHQGLKIESYFDLKNPNGQFILVDPSNQPVPDNENYFKTLVTTKTIKDTLDLRQYLKLLQSKPIEVVLATAANTLQSIKFPNHGTNGQLSNKPWITIKKVLNELGIMIWGRPVLDKNQQEAWVEIDQVNKYNPNINQIQIEFRLDSNRAANFSLSLINEQDLDINQSTLGPLTLDLKIPLKINIDQNWINEYRNQNPISGNTRFLAINQTNEQNLIKKIIDTNVTNNKLFEKVRNHLTIEYHLGAPNDQNDWFTRDQFINFLKAQTTNYSTNQISLRFKLDQSVIDNQEFNVDPLQQSFYNAQIGAPNAAIKIYLHENGMEAKLDQIKIKGTNDNFTWEFPAGLQPLNDGTFKDIPGLRIQYSTDANATNTAYGNNQNSTWSNTKPTLIDPKTKILKVQLVGDYGYIYGPENKHLNQNDPNGIDWNVHQIDVSGIKSVIKIDLSSLNLIKWSGLTTAIEIEKIKQLENQAIQQATSDQLFQSKMQFKYQIEWQKQLLSDWTDLETAANRLMTYAKDFSTTTQGLIKFNLEKMNQFATIKVRIESNDPNFVLFDQTTNQPISAKNDHIVDPSLIKTNFNFKNWFAILRQADVILGQGSTASDIKSISLAVPGQGNGFLNNLDFAQIEKLLNFFGLTLEFKAPGSNTGDQWVDRTLIKNLNNTNDLWFRIALKQTNINNLDQWATTYQITTDQGDAVLDASNQYASDPIKLKVNLPILITTKATDLEQLFTNEFSGNTWDLKIGTIKQLVETNIKTVLQNNSTADTDLTNAPLTIQFSLNEQNLDNNQAWFEIDDFVNKLKQSQTNWQTNQIKVRYQITDSADQQYHISDNRAVISLVENNTKGAKVKKYIHGGKFWDDVIKLLVPQGTSVNYQIDGLNDYVSNLANGLSISFNADENVDESKWVEYQPTLDNLPKPLGVNKKLWVRLNVSDSFEFANQIDLNTPKTTSKLLNTDNIKVLINIQKSWLDLLKVSGTLVDLQIDETPIIAAIKNAQVLPTGKDNLIMIEYQIKGGKWINRDQLIQDLKTRDGKKDDQRWILVHDDLQIRFHLNDPNNEYILNVDGTNINDENDLANVSQIFKTIGGIVQTKGVKGVINLDFFNEFNGNNFAISGDAATPLLTIKNQTQLDQLVSPYASEQLFKIEYSELWNGQAYDWSNNRSLLRSDFSGFRDQNLFIQDGVQIHSNKKMAFRFITNNQDFELKSSTQQITNNTYLLDVSDRIQVTTQIENPFTKAQKSLAILTTNDDGSAKFDQGLGQFKIVVGTKQNQPEINGTTSQLATDFIKQAFNQSPEFIDKVELVYQIFDHQPDQSEIDQAKDPVAINDYNPNSQWKQFNFNDSNGFSQGLKLKVNDYLMVALRIKQEFAFGQNAYQLLNNDHSVLIPVHQDQTTPGRVKGLFVDPSQINVNSLNLQSTLNNVSDLLDGWSAFSDLTLSDDANNNLAGLDFELELFSQFYEKNGAILISGSNSKLIKRNQNGMIQGVQYVDQDGNLMTDEQGQPIYLWTDPKTNRLSAPISANQATLKLSTKIDQNHFIIANATDLKASLFKNQKVNLVFKARNNDFTLKTQKTIDLQERVNNQLKFPVENAQNVLYDFANRDAFLSDQIKYEGIDGQKPVEKAAKIKTVLQLSRQLKTDSSQSTIISGQDGFAAITKISEQIQTDFAGQLKLTYQYKTKDGAITNHDNANFYQETKLVNGDQIILKLNTVADDLVFVDRPNDLIINISNLAVDAPEPDLLKFLRVEQSGTVDGKGSFRVLVNDPNKPVIDNEQTLNGFQFLVRVWDANQNVKIKWTSDQSELSNLRNGDRVEWKLVDEFKNPVKDAYYNTVAMPHDGKNLKFAQVNYPEGQASQTIVNLGIGDYPDNDQQYPTDSGFVISGLADSSLKFNLTQFAFEKVINTLNPTYRGQNGNGALMFNEQYMSGTWYIDLEGNIYQEPKYPDQKTQLQEIDLTTFFNHTTFYLQNPVTNPAQVGFKFKANATNTGNQLKNGDQVWATFSIESDDQFQNQTDLDPSAILTTQLPDVNNLSDATDPLSALWWILIIIGTLGTGALGWFFVKRKNKLKVKG